jgi:hypothetical protein
MLTHPPAIWSRFLLVSYLPHGPSSRSRLSSSLSQFRKSGDCSHCETSQHDVKIAVQVSSFPPESRKIPYDLSEVPRATGESVCPLEGEQGRRTATPSFDFLTRQARASPRPDMMTRSAWVEGCSYQKGRVSSTRARVGGGRESSFRVLDLETRRHAVCSMYICMVQEQS